MGRYRTVSITSGLIAIAAGLMAPMATADRVTAFIEGGGGYCNIDTYMKSTVLLTAKTVEYNTITDCVLVPVRVSNVNAYLREEFNGQDEGTVAEAHQSCVATPSHCSTQAAFYHGLTTFDYRNYGDATLELYPAGSTKNPAGTKWATPAPPRCTVYNGGYSIFCAQLSDGSV